MLDYSKTTKESKSYIISYSFDKKDIVVKYANDETVRFPYSKDVEETIVDTMEEQAKNAKPTPPTVIQQILCFSQPIAFPITIYNIITNHTDTFRYAIAAIVGFGAIYYPAKAIDYFNRKNDVEKLDFFLENKEEFNRSFVNRKFRKVGLDRKIGLTKGISRKAFKSIEKELEIKRNPDQTKHIPQPININNIDSYSLRDLERIKLNIEELKAKYPEEIKTRTPEEQTSEVLTLKKKPQAVAVCLFSDEK